MLNYLTFNNLMHLLDILLVWFVLYKMIRFVRGTRTVQILLGIAVIIVIKIISWYLDLTTISWTMDQIINWGPIALVIIFQQEIRRGLEELGQRAMLRKNHHHTIQEKNIDAIDMAIQYMAKRRIGALIVIEKTATLNDYAKTGIALEAAISGQLLINIFIPNTPLHDGAVIVQNHRIQSAAAYLPLSESTRISKEYGTRHRAAVGISEVTDAVALVVSEETGGVSIALSGALLTELSRDNYLDILKKQLLVESIDHQDNLFNRVLNRSKKESEQ